MSKMLAPIYLPGQEPMPAGTTPEEREEMQNVQRWQKYATMGMESCPVKVGMSAGAGESVEACSFAFRISRGNAMRRVDESVD